MWNNFIYKKLALYFNVFYIILFGTEADDGLWVAFFVFSFGFDVCHLF